MTARQRKPLILAMASLIAMASPLATTAATADEAQPAPAPQATEGQGPQPAPPAVTAAPSSVTVAPPPAAEPAPAPAPPAAPPPKKEQQEAAAKAILDKSAPPVRCFSGFHTSFDYDITGTALSALGRKVIEPGGLCDQYREYAGYMPVEIGVPLLPGVSVNIDKLCQMVQRPPCPEPPADHAESQDQPNK